MCLSNSDVSNLERLQDRAETYLFGEASSGQWPSLRSERQRNASLFTYKCVNGLIPDVFEDYFEKSNYGKETISNAVNLKLPKKTIFKPLGKAFSFKGPFCSTNCRKT